MSEAQPAALEPELRWEANEGPQKEFLASSAYEVLYGGAAGGGKSEAMVMDALRYVEHPTYQAILFRRTFPELHKSLIERSLRYYNAAFPSASYNDTKHVWKMPGGALIWFGHLEHDTSVYQHQSAEYQYIGFEELTHFTEWQYKYLLSRARGSNGVPIRIRANTNPGGDGHLWVQRRWAPWLGPPPEDSDAYTGPRATPGEVLWYVSKKDGERWVSRTEAKAINARWKLAPRLEQLQLPLALSRTFIPAKLKDNPKIDAAYAATLRGLDPVTEAQLAGGDWMIRPAPGLYFKRAWFKFVDSAPAVARRMRYWDLAGTDPKKQKTKGDPDWTVGLLLAITAKNEVFVEHVMRFRGDPSEVESTILATAEVDGHEVSIGLPQDPGQAGKFQAGYFVGQLSGYVVHALPETGDKVTRAGPISAQAKAGNVSLVRGRWNGKFVQELEEFPGTSHDDQVDALSGAFSRLVGNPAPTYAGLPPVVGKWGGRGR
jgi:predicted phage terminase large subunit-like protein